MISDRRPSAGGLLAGAVFKFGPQRGNAQLEVGAESGQCHLDPETVLASGKCFDTRSAA